MAKGGFRGGMPGGMGGMSGGMGGQRSNMGFQHPDSIPIPGGR